jgi:predicted Zn finger-like uncharacterized protein
MMILRLATLFFGLSSSLVASFSLQSAARPTTALRSQQAEYGEAQDLPETYVKCGRCQAVYAIKEEDLGPNGRGRRLSCSVCTHSWFQSKDRIMRTNGNFDMVGLPDVDRERIKRNIEEGKNPGFLGDAKLYVGNVAFECHENDLFEIFAELGEVGEVSLVRDDEGKNRGFGFITMRSQDVADRAIEALDGVDMRGRKLTVRASNN